MARSGSAEWLADIRKLAARMDAINDGATAYAAVFDPPVPDDQLAKQDQIIRARHRARFGSGEHT